MSAFKTILFKELKSMIRDPKILIAMIIAPFIIVGIMYGIMVFSTQQMVREALMGKGVIVLVDEDRGYWAKNFTEYLEETGYKIINVGDREELISSIKNRSILCGLVIPHGFTENITRNTTAYVEVYIYIASPSMSYLVGKSRALTVINEYSKNITMITAELHGLNPEYISTPINTTLSVIVKNRVLKVNDLGSIIGGFTIMNIAFPLLALILASFLVQLTATSIAVEKEEKMFETILSLPINRFSFIVAKIIATVIVGLLGVTLYGVLFMWYFSAITRVSSEPSGSNSGFSSIVSVIGSVYGYGAMTLMFIALFSLVLFILGLSIILALFAEDVRSAQMITSYIVMPFLFVFLINMFMDLSSIEPMTRYVLALIPLANLGFMTTYIFIEDWTAAYLAVASSIVYAVIAMYIASRLIASEKVFTLRLFRRRKTHV